MTAAVKKQSLRFERMWVFALDLRRPHLYSTAGWQPVWSSPDASYPHWQVNCSHNFSEIKENLSLDVISSTRLYHNQAIVYCYNLTLHYLQPYSLLCSLYVRLLAISFFPVFSRIFPFCHTYIISNVIALERSFPTILCNILSFIPTHHSQSKYCFDSFIVFKWSKIILFTYLFLIFRLLL